VLLFTERILRMEEKLGVIADNPNYNNGKASEDDLF
jgi:hypothetical protein